MEEKVSCADIQPEIQPQVMGFSAQLAGMTSDLALKVLLGKTEDDTTVCQYLLNALGHGYDRDNNALRCLVYKRLPKGSESELYGMIDKPIIQMTFDRALPKEKLWNQFRDVLGEDIQAFRMNLLWSMNFPLCYSSVNTVSCIAVAEGSGVDENLGRLPDSHVYLVEGEEDDYLVELTLTEPIQDS